MNGPGGYYLLLLITFVMGFTVSIQTGINAKLGKCLGNPLMASFVSFAVGALALLLVLLISRIGWPTEGRLASVPLWAWTGGVFGAAFITTMIIMAPRLGATSTLSLIVAGQMVAALVLDHFGWLGFPEHPIHWMRVLGVGLLIVGMLMIQRF